ncbi:DEAD/DEAH box helicase [Roseicella aerolata]|uniref:DEAD/DEAH box helicase family protein n=1 Tax=Roseicella aerolata TaxID=2883479 RepID=A0A9X1IIF7_9PROT|nr:DEAD/DEAH box helicase family protein [Roseicella aerolata]MCB4825471.1 DEAD/DEAH box helicase family protein [Roseicella aerolata]
MDRRLRSHQAETLAVVRAIACGEARDVHDILAAVTPGGGKSLLPVLAAQALIEAGVCERVCWVVPRDSLRLQAEEAFADPGWRAALGHALSVRAAENAPDLCRGLAGYVTTYQGVAAAPDLHLAEFRRHRYLLVVDEVHHLPAVGANDNGMTAPDDAAGWSTAIEPLLALAAVRLLLSGTLERADGRRILGLPYRRAAGGREEVDLAAPGLAVIGYSRARALSERAVLPVSFGALDGEASWLGPEAETGERPRLGPHRLRAPAPNEATRPALFTALRTGFAEALLRRAFEATRRLRAERRARLTVAPGEPARGLGKLLVVAPDQTQARRYLDTLRRWVPPHQAGTLALAVSEERGAHETLAAFRLTPEPSVLVTVAMAYEGLDAPEVAVVAALTQIRSRPWLEQMVARATRVDPNAGPYEAQRATVFHPDDPLFARFRWRMEREQGTRAAPPKPSRQPRLPIPGWLEDELAEARARSAIVPLESNALALRLSTLRPGPDLAAGLAAARAPDPQGDLLEAPSVAERRLRARLGELVASQAVEDMADGLAHTLMPAGRGDGLYHAYNAALKRATGGKSRATMSLAELEAAVEWLGRNRLRDHLHLLEADHRYGWRIRPRGEWKPPVGRPAAARARAGGASRCSTGTEEAAIITRAHTRLP